MLEPVIVVAGDDMDMAMHDFLSCASLIVYVNIDSVSVDGLFYDERELLRGQMHPGPCFCGHGVDVFKMVLWEDEGMPRVHGLDIEKGKGLVVLVYLVRRYVPGDDLAEDAVRDAVVL